MDSMACRPKLDGSVRDLFGRDPDEQLHMLRFDIPIHLLDPRFIHPLLLWMLTSPHKCAPPLTFPQLSTGGFNDILSRLKDTATKRNMPTGFTSYQAIFSRIGTPMRQMLDAFPRRPSLLPNSPFLSVKTNILLYLFLAVNNLQADDVLPAGDSHAPYTNRIANYLFRKFKLLEGFRCFKGFCIVAYPDSRSSFNTLFIQHTPVMLYRC
jgi:hypothetical protein